MAPAQGYMGRPGGGSRPPTQEVGVDGPPSPRIPQGKIPSSVVPKENPETWEGLVGGGRIPPLHPPTRMGVRVDPHSPTIHPI